MAYQRFGLMILTSTVVMFILMYLNTYALEHVFFSETRIYMALLMGATMAVVMLAFMLGMYKNRNLNIVIFIGAVVVFALTLWLVRSQVTVSGTSYMRAMIPHHSIAIMTSERAGINDARVRKLADGIIAAQNREIAEMRYLIADIANSGAQRNAYQDPEPAVGSVQEALDNLLISELDPAPLGQRDIEKLDAQGANCAFRRTASEDPILVSAEDGSRGAMKLNGVLIALEGKGQSSESVLELSASGVTMRVNRLADGFRDNAELIFSLDMGLTVGYRGFYDC